MPDTLFESSRGRSFRSRDFSFEQIDYIELDRIALNAVSAPIPGGQPLFFRPQEGERGLRVRFVYTGKHFWNDITKFASRLHNGKHPLRIILDEEQDRYYVGQIVKLPTTSQFEELGFVETEAQLYRNFALRRWRDDEITPDNPEINFSMPIVPIQAEHNLTGSTAAIPYYNEGVDLPPVLELRGVDFPAVLAGDTYAVYLRAIDRALTVDFDTLTARENGTDRSLFLFGEKVVIPNGEQRLRVHYSKTDELVKSVVQSTAEDFMVGTQLRNLQIAGPDEDNAIIQSIQRGTPVFLRDDPGYNDDGTEVQEDDPRFGPGPFSENQAVRIEEAVTQELTNADWESLSGWTVFAGVTQTDRHRGVAQILRASAGNGTTRVNLLQRIPASPGQTITLQVLARKVGPVDYAEIRMSFETSSQTFISSATKVITNDLTDEFQLFSVTGTAPENTAFVAVRPMYDGGTQRQNAEWEAVMPMVTRTPYVWGWHRSGVKEREEMVISNSLLFNDAEGSIAVWVYEDGSNRIGHVWKVDGPGSAIELYRSDGDTYNLESLDGLSFEIETPAVGWHLWELRWARNEIELYLDGAIAVRNTNYTPNIANADFLTVGNDEWFGDSHWNGLIGPLKITNFEVPPASPTEEFKVDPFTSYFLPMNRNLNYYVGGLFISNEIDISTSRQAKKARLRFEQNLGGALIFETRLILGGVPQDWTPVSFDGTIRQISPETDLSDAKIQYRAEFQTTQPIFSPQALSRVIIELESEREGSLVIKNRKRLA